MQTNPNPRYRNGDFLPSFALWVQFEDFLQKIIQIGMLYVIINLIGENYAI